MIRARIPELSICDTPLTDDQLLASIHNARGGRVTALQAAYIALFPHSAERGDIREFVPDRFRPETLPDKDTVSALSAAFRAGLHLRTPLTPEDIHPPVPAADAGLATLRQEYMARPGDPDAHAAYAAARFILAGMEA